MISRLKTLFTGAKDQTTNYSNNDIKLASAIVLLEAACADDSCSQDELDHILHTIQQTQKLSHEESSELIELATNTRKHEVDLWQFTNKMNSEFSQQEKQTLMESVWEIIFLDGHLEAREDHFAHKLANLLRLTHKELIDAKMKVKYAT